MERAWESNPNARPSKAYETQHLANFYAQEKAGRQAPSPPAARRLEIPSPRRRRQSFMAILGLCGSRENDERPERNSTNPNFLRRLPCHSWSSRMGRRQSHPTSIQPSRFVSGRAHPRSTVHATRTQWQAMPRHRPSRRSTQRRSQLNPARISTLRRRRSMRDRKRRSQWQIQPLPFSLRKQ
jgi:hypothetical protein